MTRKTRSEHDARDACSRARAMYQSGYDVESISSELSTYSRVVKFWLGIDESGWEYSEMIALRNRGVTMREIADRVGVPVNYVWHTIGSQQRRSDTVVRQLRLNRRSWDRLPLICDALDVRKIIPGAKPTNSIARMLDGIADGHLEVRWKDGKSPDNVSLGIDS